MYKFYWVGQAKSALEKDNMNGINLTLQKGIYAR